MKIYKLKPVGKSCIWGGERLKQLYHKDLDIFSLAETWECSTHPDGMCEIEDCEGKTVTLADILQEHPEYLGDHIGNQKQLPILIKFIDAKLPLSIQVHPNDEYAIANEEQLGKNEFWYVADASDHAEILLGLAHNMNPHELCDALDTRTLEHHLRHIKTSPGDCFCVPAGTAHGIGAGNLIVEVQDASTLTYRLYDYGRTDHFGKQRPLHIEKAVSAMNKTQYNDNIERHTIHSNSAFCEEELCKTDRFSVRLLKVNTHYNGFSTDESFQVLLILEGTGQIQSHDDRKTVTQGCCLFIPADLGAYQIEGNVKFLLVRAYASANTITRKGLVKA